MGRKWSAVEKVDTDLAVVDLPQPIKLLLPTKKLGVGASVLIFVLNCISYVYDFFTTMDKSQAENKLKFHQHVKGEVIAREKGSTTWRGLREKREIHKEMEKLKIDTMHKVFSLAIRKNLSQDCLGTRELLVEEEEIQSDGKVLKKCELGEYSWMTYSEVDAMATAFSCGLIHLGLETRGKICIFAETRAEWFISAIGAFKNSNKLVTLYATLGDDAVIHALNETECSIVLTSSELLPKFKSILDNTPHIKHLIFMEHPHKKTSVLGYRNDVELHPYKDVIANGKATNGVDLQHPEPEDVAIIMYTSGSTGTPKGVLLSHKNVAASMIGLADALGETTEDDCYIGYLPLAHVLELVSESCCFLNAVRIGYSSPLTLTDKSAKIKTGCKGDASVLKPTIMVAVPFALDRIYKMILEQVNQGSPIKQALFFWAYDYKLKWTYKGYSCPIVDSIIMKRTKLVVGGRVRVMVSGGAPLSGETQEFVRMTLCTPGLAQGYGLTETSGAGGCGTFGDMSVGRIGPPFRGCDFRLTNWEEGNYTVDDKPLPRGEVVIGGDNVAIGYLNQDEATAQDFFEEGGKKWFRTGDIAEVDVDGCFRIIDRKKDLVKLQMGEYLSLGKLEAILKTCPYIDNVCVHGDPTKNFCVALIVPNEKQLTDAAHNLGLGNLSWERICCDNEMEAFILREVQEFCKIAKLHRFEIPAAIKLCSDLWTPENNMVTTAFKLRRRFVCEKYKKEIDNMYR